MVVRRSALQRSGDKNAPQALFKPICVQYGFRFFVTEKSEFVSSTASDRGLGAEPQAYFAYFCTNKSRPPLGRRAN